ncbi:hypothetical protein JOB18_020476 [Solea senegalensis]|uniref:Uncharacterized protein n=1 Tax=Solea senegalensis TaxID=28829 RepID=A0AAV6S801_SOLSE|nr:hypothetical protein JOB18_020476 [Solea senegalensis]
MMMIQVLWKTTTDGDPETHDHYNFSYNEPPPPHDDVDHVMTSGQKVTVPHTQQGNEKNLLSNSFH